MGTSNSVNVPVTQVIVYLLVGWESLLQSGSYGCWEYKVSLGLVVKEGPLCLRIQNT